MQATNNKNRKLVHLTYIYLCIDIIAIISIQDDVQIL